MCLNQVPISVELVIILLILQMGRWSSRKFEQFDCDLKFTGNSLTIWIHFGAKASERAAGAFSTYFL